MSTGTPHGAERAEAGGAGAVVAALAANLGIAVLKFGAFALTRSSSMLAEGIHSLADSGNQVLLLVGGRRARRAATPEHPFGYGRERYLYAFVVSVVLFSVGGLFALYEAWHKLQDVLEHPRDLGDLDGRWWWVPLAVLLGAIVMEGLSFRTAVREARTVKAAEVGWVEFVRRAKAPELPVILLEDFAALIGLVLALLGVGLALLTGYAVFDAVGTALIGVLLVTVAVVLAAETRSLLVGEAASPAVQDRIRGAVEDTAGVERIIHMRTLHLGPEELLVGVKIAVAPTESAAEVAATIDRAEAALRAAEPSARVVYVEPDVLRQDHGPLPTV